MLIAVNNVAEVYQFDLLIRDHAAYGLDIQFGYPRYLDVASQRLFRKIDSRPFDGLIFPIGEKHGKPRPRTARRPGKYAGQSLFLSGSGIVVDVQQGGPAAFEHESRG